jgi:hypothetical protein
MVAKTHCPTCGFVMMYSIEKGITTYTCVNTHDAVIEDDLGPNLDILLEYLKRP